MFYNNYVSLCNKIGKSPSAAAEEMGYQRSVVTRWSKGTDPRQATLQKVADYFGVTVAELTAENEKSPAPEGAELTPDQIKAIEKIKNMPPEELARKMAALEAVLDM